MIARERYIGWVPWVVLPVLMNACLSRQDSWHLRSPDKKIMISVSKRGNPDKMDDKLFYSVSMKAEGKRLEIIGPSPLGLPCTGTPQGPASVLG